MAAVIFLEVFLEERHLFLRRELGDIRQRADSGGGLGWRFGLVLRRGLGFGLRFGHGQTVTSNAEAVMLWRILLSLAQSGDGARASARFNFRFRAAHQIPRLLASWDVEAA